jgi:hypothetical protein
LTLALRCSGVFRASRARQAARWRSFAKIGSDFGRAGRFRGFFCRGGFSGRGGFGFGSFFFGGGRFALTAGDYFTLQITKSGSGQSVGAGNTHVDYIPTS